MVFKETEEMKHLDLFSGIGGFALAARWMGWETVQFVELDKFCQQVLKKHWPNVPIHDDIKTFDGTRFRGTVDIVTGGPPCQPASSAGKRKGENDDRWFWPEAIRVFGDIRPSIAVFENPDDLLSLDMGKPFERICSSMENLGYKVETFGIPAACVGAWHERDRIWIIAYDDHRIHARKLDDGTNRNQAQAGEGSHKRQRQTSNRQRIWFESDTSAPAATDTDTQGLQRAAQNKFRSVSEQDESLQGCAAYGGTATPGAYWSAEPGVGRMVHGVSNRVDRIKSLGNAIVRKSYSKSSKQLSK